MTAESSHNEIYSFIQFLSNKVSCGNSEFSPEEGLREFREYQQQATRFKKELQDSIDSGPAKPLDRQALMQRVQEWLAEKVNKY